MVRLDSIRNRKQLRSVPRRRSTDCTRCLFYPTGHTFEVLHTLRRMNGNMYHLMKIETLSVFFLREKVLSCEWIPPSCLDVLWCWDVLHGNLLEH